jgi:hypothetical protein
LLVFFFWVLFVFEKCAEGGLFSTTFITWSIAFSSPVRVKAVLSLKAKP